MGLLGVKPLEMSFNTAGEHTRFQREPGSNSCSSGKGRGCLEKGKSSQETILQPWDRVLVPVQRVHKTISQALFAGPTPQQVVTMEFRLPAEVWAVGSRAVLDVMIFAFLLFPSSAFLNSLFASIVSYSHQIKSLHTVFQWKEYTATPA